MRKLWLIVLAIMLAGCGSSASLSVGQKLLKQDGSEWGTILELSDSHTFDNGETEPGALVQEVTPPDVRPMEPQWYPQDSLVRSLDEREQAAQPAADGDQNKRAYEEGRKTLVAASKVSPDAQFPPYKKDFVTWVGPGLYEVEATVWDKDMTAPTGWAANVQWDAKKGWIADAALLKIAATPTPFGDANASAETQLPESTNAIGETPDEERERLAQERETRRQSDIDYHQSKIEDLETERARLVASLDSNASPDVVMQEIAVVDRQIEQENDSILTIQNQR